MTPRMSQSLHAPFAIAALLAMPAILHAQGRVVVRDAGPGEMGRVVRSALARPHVVVAGDTGDLVLPRDTTIRQGLVVLGRDVRVAAAIQGDLVVIGGDVYLRPGVRIDGDVVATGGGIYPTMLGTVGGDQHAYRDQTLVPALLADGSYALDYRELRARTFASFSLPGIKGVRIPAYDRVNGATLPWAPFIQLDSGRISLEPTVTYRSHLGKVDPSVSGTMSMGRRGRTELFAGRTTRTNDAWISGNLGNSISSLFSGRDTRNWYRADVVEAAYHRTYEGRTSVITPYLGGQWERAWSTGIQEPPRHVAYSFFSRSDTVEGMARPNPAVVAGNIASAVAGLAGEWESPAQRLEVRGTGRLEFAPQAAGGERFTQLTLDGRVEFPLVRNIDFRLDWHGVGSVGSPPPQRYAYLGGSGTLKTMDLLSQGGDQLVYVESRASMPVERIRLPVVGSPTVMLRHMMGSAGVGGLPGLTHNIGLRISMTLVKAEFVIDPVSGETDFGVGFSFSP